SGFGGWRVVTRASLYCSTGTLRRPAWQGSTGVIDLPQLPCRSGKSREKNRIPAQNRSHELPITFLYQCLMKLLSAPPIAPLREAAGEFGRKAREPPGRMTPRPHSFR